MKNLTEVVFILDRSGSMSGLESDTIGGFNSMLKKQREAEGEVLISTVLFDHESIVLHDRVPLADVKNLTEEDYEVRGSTALLDAVGDAIKHVRNIHKYAREEDRPAKTVFIITTDGMENSSVKFSHADVKKLIEDQKKKNWEFIFLGANIDAVEVADSIGIKANRAVNYHSDSQGTEKAFEAFGEFLTCAADSRVQNVAAIDSSWRKKIDKDFQKRSRKKSAK